MKLTWKSALALLLYLAMLTAMAEGTGVLTLPAGLKTIEEEAFHGDTSVASVVIPEGTAEIGPHAFAHSSLTEITIPASVRAIADDAFEGCENLTATVIENSYAHTRCVEIGVAVDVIECKHTPNENCVCTVCGAEAHTPGEDCVCAFCGTEAHALDENCVCAGCGETMHEMKAFGDISEPCHACVNCDYETHQMVDHDFYIQNAVSYTEYDELYHISYGTPVFVTHCIACDSILGEVVTGDMRSLQEYHVYEEDNTCELCGYHRCRHIFDSGCCECTLCGETVHNFDTDIAGPCICSRCGIEANHNYSQRLVIESRKTAYYDDAWHIETKYPVLKTTCSDCGKVDETAEVTVFDPVVCYEIHQYDGDRTCDVCGYIREGECSHSTAREVIRSYIYDGQTTSVTDTHRTGIGYRTKSIYCDLCYRELEYVRLEENVEITIEHEFDQRNCCDICGYVPACPHSSASEQLLEMSEYNTAYYPIDAEAHLAKGTGYYIMVCNECGRPANNDYAISRYTELTQPHNFIPGTSICMDCGYCPHEETVTETVSELGVYCNITQVSHTLADVETVTVRCADCGLVISSEEKLSNAVQYVHTDLDTACVCGYVCPHTETHEEVYSWSWDDNDLVNVTEYVHTYRADATVRVVCDTCETTVSSYTRQENRSDTHYFDENGACWECGYVNTNTAPECTHDRADFGELWLECVGYANITETGHTCIYNEVADLSCPDCDYYEDLTFGTGIEVEESHSFYEGMCSCGYGTSTEHAHEFADDSCVCLTCGETEHDESYWMEYHGTCQRCGEVWHDVYYRREVFDSIDKYTPAGEYGHYVSGPATVYDYCWECSLVLKESRHDVYNKWEDHTFENGACTKCGFEGCAHENTSGCYCWDCGEYAHNNDFGCRCIDCGQLTHPYSEERFGIVDAVYAPHDNDQHWAEGSAAVYSYCRSCKVEVPYTRSILAEGVRQLEDHRYAYKDGMRTCLDCGYVWQYETAVCSHANTELRRREYLDEILEVNETYEIGVGHIIEYDYCLDCEYWLNETVIEENVPMQKVHVFNYGDALCFNCDYEFICMHADVEWTVSSYHEGICVEDDAGSHIFKGMVILSGRCNDCGVSVYDGDYDGEKLPEYREIRLPHNFENSVCTDCGYYTDCSHAGLGNPVVTEDVRLYESSPDSHRMVTTRTETAAVEPHDFVDGVCACGLHEQPAAD